MPNAIYRLLNNTDLSYNEFIKEFESIVDEYKDYITDQIAQHILENNKSLAVPTCNKMAREIIKKRWNCIESKLAMVSGKDLIKKINQWLRKKYNKSCSIDKIISALHPEEIDNEIIDVLKLIS